MQQATALGDHAMAAVAKLHGCGRRIAGKVAKRCARAEGGEVGPDLRDDSVDLTSKRHTSRSTHFEAAAMGMGSPYAHAG